ncbi:sulfatase family protein [Rathayibacter sp. CAU 1779]
MITPQSQQNGRVADSEGRSRPNVLVILTDEWRAQATGYAGDENAATPRLDALAGESLNFTNAVSGSPVCCPARASLLTGRYPLQHGVYVNDVELDPRGATTLGEAFKAGGYRTGFIGKWHLHGSPDGAYGRRDLPVPAEKHLGFDYWKAAECTHDYNHSLYYAGSDPTPRYWSGYDADAQTADARDFILDTDAEQPYLLVVSFGPPHFPLNSAPREFRERYEDAPITLRPNVPQSEASESVRALRGYYAHIAALDACIAHLLDAVDDSGRADDTVVVFTSDHGDMMGSQGIRHDVKGLPWDESLRIPLLIRYPRRCGADGVEHPDPIDLPDLMPTLLDLADLPIPPEVSGTSAFTAERRGSSFIGMPVPILWARAYGIGEYRGIRTTEHTYVRSRSGPWLLYDNINDPFQSRNLVEDPRLDALRHDLDMQLRRWLDVLDDEFLPGDTYAYAEGISHYREVNNPIGSSKGPGEQWRSTLTSTTTLQSAAAAIDKDD